MWIIKLNIKSSYRVQINTTMKIHGVAPSRMGRVELRESFLVRRGYLLLMNGLELPKIGLLQVSTTPCQPSTTSKAESQALTAQRKSTWSFLTDKLQTKLSCQLRTNTTLSIWNFSRQNLQTGKLIRIRGWDIDSLNTRKARVRTKAHMIREVALKRLLRGC